MKSYSFSVTSVGDGFSVSQLTLATLVEIPKVTDPASLPHLTLGQLLEALELRLRPIAMPDMARPIPPIPYDEAERRRANGENWLGTS